MICPVCDSRAVARRRRLLAGHAELVYLHERGPACILVADREAGAEPRIGRSRASIRREQVADIARILGARGTPPRLAVHPSPEEVERILGAPRRPALALVGAGATPLELERDPGRSHIGARSRLRQVGRRK